MDARSLLNVFLREPREWLKLVEIILGLICLGITRGVVLMGGRPDWFLLSFFTPSAFLLITSILLLTKLVEDPLKPPLAEIVFDSIAVPLYLAAGCCSLEYYSSFETAPQFKASGIAYGVLSIITALVYLSDAALPYKDMFPDITCLRTFAQKNLRVWT